jgi:hypothetical protein
MSKVAITGNASGTGTFTIAAPNSNTDRTLTLPDQTGTILTSASNSEFPVGSVLQVLSTTKTDTFSTTSTSFTDITGLSVSITPKSATSKIFVIASLCGASNGNANTAQYRLMRDSTAIGIGDAAGSRSRSSSGLTYQADTNRLDSYTFQTLDSPATTSATTYKVQMITSGSTAYIGRTFADTDSATWPRTICTITVMEIAA